MLHFCSYSCSLTGPQLTAKEDNHEREFVDIRWAQLSCLRSPCPEGQPNFFTLVSIQEQAPILQWVTSSNGLEGGKSTQGYQDALGLGTAMEWGSMQVCCCLNMHTQGNWRGRKRVKVSYMFSPSTRATQSSSTGPRHCQSAHDVLSTVPDPLEKTENMLYHLCPPEADHVLHRAWLPVSPHSQSVDKFCWSTNDSHTYSSFSLLRDSAMGEILILFCLFECFYSWSSCSFFFNLG